MAATALSATQPPRWTTPDLCDAYGDAVRVAEPLLRHFGGQEAFCGRIATVKCFEDNSKVGESLRAAGDARVLVVDGGGSLRRSLLGDKLVQLAIDNNWAGIIINGCARDIEQVREMPVGVMALASIPRKTEKRGEGRCAIPVEFAGLTFNPDEYIYADANGIIVSAQPLAL